MIVFLVGVLGLLMVAVLVIGGIEIVKALKEIYGEGRK